ncbi:gas vesicle protein GvpG [Luteipulveratus sp. YIM 133132]|uniref:Gas vesicle protein GvpG n=1 Tax=Luteipulveratus flavus TaxID=3031728 RepID=A0ABT6C8X1_9MICO|nr:MULTISPECIES: gas vesicle protein GvpG [unclassified Luteipulveratus]MDE9366917.1 gas vesicle protein GvpG [Luteipulveratus sp. YIM 133132]MDF8264747.1 gas vesicle protein GvpG [Luteipulveratus sp. YIM 133296]
MLTTILTLPLMPVRGAVWVADQVRQEAERQMTDPRRVVEQLEAVDHAREDGRLSEAEAAELENELLQRLRGGPGYP